MKSRGSKLIDARLEDPLTHLAVSPGGTFSLAYEGPAGAVAFLSVSFASSGERALVAYELGADPRSDAVTGYGTGNLSTRLFA